MNNYRNKIFGIIAIMASFVFLFQNCGSEFASNQTGQFPSTTLPEGPHPDGEGNFNDRPPIINKVSHLNVGEKSFKIEPFFSRANITSSEDTLPFEFEEGVHVGTRKIVTNGTEAFVVHYGPFTSFLDGSVQKLNSPEPEKLDDGFEFFSREYSKSISGKNRRYSLLHTYKNETNKKIKAKLYTFSYQEGQASWLLYYETPVFNDTEEANTRPLNASFITKNWIFIDSPDSTYLFNKLTNQKVDLDTKSHIGPNDFDISPDEEWLVHANIEDGQCYLTNLKTGKKNPISIQTAKNSFHCSIQLIGYGLYLTRLSGGGHRTGEFSDKPIIMTHMETGTTYEFSSHYFHYDEAKEIITYSDENNQVHREYIDEFINDEISQPLFTFKDRKSFGYGYINRETPTLTTLFNYETGYYALLNNNTRKLTNYQDYDNLLSTDPLLSSMFGRLLERDGVPYLQNLSTGLIAPATLTNTAPGEKQIINCETPDTPYTNFSQTCLAQYLKSKKPFKNMFTYKVRFPLLTENVSNKKRWIYLPPTTKIDNSDSNNWTFPKGTILWKSFAQGTNKLEVRMLEKISDELGDKAWRKSTFVWNNDETDAIALETGTTLPLANNKNHSVPNIQSCTSCHMGNKDFVAGFNQLQLEDGLEELGRLDTLYKDGLLSQQPTHFDDIPVPAGVDKNIAVSFTPSRNAVGMLVSNCASCHSPNGSCSAPGLDFSYALGTDDVKKTNTYLTSVEKNKLVPGDGENSQLYSVIKSGFMPLGSKEPHSLFADRIKAWIDSLEK